MDTGYSVGNIMTQNPIVVGPSATLEEVANVMTRNHVGAVLVTEGQKLHGIITENDVIKKTVAKGVNPVDMTAAEIMEKNLTTITPDKDISYALKLLGRENIRHLPVIEDEVFVGLMTLKDALKIQPHLFELIAHQITIREESNKPVNRINPDEGICNLCGEYSAELVRKDNISICRDCDDSESI
ncbi:MAG: cyclic nucleotide-binding/CBS domain-containing protein [Candidatus Woesearchaeota archaeon]